MARRVSSLILAVAVWELAAGAAPTATGPAAAPADGRDTTRDAVKAGTGKPMVTITQHDADRRIDVTVDGKPFTAYVWPTSLKKPVLNPLRTAQGTIVTRGFPLDPRPGERVDHPHHVGLWFNYGDVNGVDFWNNSTSIKPADAPKMGTIQHRAVRQAKSGAGEGTLGVSMDWVLNDGTVVLKEDTDFVFRASGADRIIDRVTTLTAQDAPVSFKDNKEGVIGIRVRRQLEEPTNEPAVFTDASGRPTTVKAMDNTGVTGVYLTSEGVKGGNVWGTRGRWCALSGTVDGEDVTLVIFDHPRNPGYPTYWHARGYGLFAANPLGQNVFSEGKETLNFALAPKARTRFVHRILLLHGPADPADLEARYTAFTKAIQ